MIQQEILDFNKRCAEFLGKEYSDNRIVTPYTHFSGQNPTGKVWEECRYHSDWNWIMEVVEAIEKLDYDVVIAKTSCSIWIGGTSYSGSSKDCKTKKEAVIQAINQFLIWYNEQRS